MKNITRRQVPEALAERTSFSASALSAKKFDPPVKGTEVSAGRLPEDARAALRSAEVGYVIYSYITPIAWETAEGEFVIPQVKYSATTSRHQSLVQSALLD